MAVRPRRVLYVKTLDDDEFKSRDCEVAEAIIDLIDSVFVKCINA